MKPQMFFKMPLAALAGLVLLAQGVFAQGAFAQGLSSQELAGVRFRSISIDTSAYEAQGGSGVQPLRAALMAQAQSLFADRLAPHDAKAATLVIKVDSMMWTNVPGHFGRHGLGSSFSDDTTDYMEGDGLIMRNGHVVFSHHMLASLGAHNSGFGQERLNALSNYYVAWMKKEMGL